MEITVSLSHKRLSEIGSRIRNVRKWLRLSQSFVARQLRISRASLSEVEAGRRPLGYDELVFLCRLFHCRPEFLIEDSPFFWGEDSASEVEPEIREDARLSDRDAHVISAFLSHVRSTNVSEARGVFLNELRAAIKGAGPKVAAINVRELCGKQGRPMRLFRLMAQAGVELYFASMEKASSSRYCPAAPGKAFGVLLNESQSEDRVRLNAGRQLYAILNSEVDPISLRTSMKGRSFLAIDQEAELFSNELLIPEDILLTAFAGDRQSIRSADSLKLLVCELSQTYFLQPQTIITRILRSGLISQAQAKVLEEWPEDFEEKSSSVSMRDVSTLLKTLAENLNSSRNTPHYLRQLQEFCLEEYWGVTHVRGISISSATICEMASAWTSVHQPPSGLPDIHQLELPV